MQRYGKPQHVYVPARAHCRHCSGNRAHYGGTQPCKEGVRNSGCPVAMSTLPMDDGARFKNWREMFVTKIILAYGAVLAVNIFVLILPIINGMHIDGVSDFANSMFTVFMIVGGAMIIPAGQTLFARLFAQSDDMRANKSYKQWWTQKQTNGNKYYPNNSFYHVLHYFPPVFRNAYYL